VREQTHPLPRGGTDLIAFELSLTFSFLCATLRVLCALCV
jgi:hypothetical protein